MSTKKHTTIVKGNVPPPIIDPMRDYDKDPYVLKKLEKGKAFLKAHPIPEEFLKK